MKESVLVCYALYMSRKFGSESINQRADVVDRVGRWSLWELVEAFTGLGDGSIQLTLDFGKSAQDRSVNKYEWSDYDDG